MGHNYHGEMHRSRSARLLELVDGAMGIVELWKVESPAQVEWQKKWLASASAELRFAEENRCRHEYWFRCKCGRPICRKCEQEYEEDGHG